MLLKDGQKYVIKDGNDTWVGEVVENVFPTGVWLRNASWVADSGRWSAFLATGQADDMEIEPCGPDPIFVTVRSAFPWNHALFTEAV